MATFLAVDYQKSITKARLVYKTSPRLIFTYVLSAFNAFVLLAIVIMPVLLRLPEPFFRSPYYIAIVIIIYCWAIINIGLLNSFVRIDGTNPSDNRKDIVEALSKHFKLENLDETITGMIRDVRLPSTFKNGRAITCLLDENMIYLNTARLIRPANIYFYSAVFMRYKCKRVAKEFQKLRADSFLQL